MGFHYDVPISLGLALSSISLLVVSWVDLRDVICVVCVCHHGRSQDASQAESETQVQWNGRREQETQVMALDKCVSASAGVATYEKFEAAPRSLSSIIHQLVHDSPYLAAGYSSASRANVARTFVRSVANVIPSHRSLHSNTKSSSTPSLGALARKIEMFSISTMLL